VREYGLRGRDDAPGVHDKLLIEQLSRNTARWRRAKHTRNVRQDTEPSEFGGNLPGDGLQSLLVGNVGLKNGSATAEFANVRCHGFGRFTLRVVNQRDGCAVRREPARNRSADTA
jgi:hypothetical protein